MIEVEKRFQPTREQLEALISNATFLGKSINHDIYYDYSDYHLSKQGIKFRSRNGVFELKKKLGEDKVKAEEEITDEKQMQDYFQTSKSLTEFVAETMIVFMDYQTERSKYQKDNFTIDVDNLSFGYNMVEIELMIDTVSDVAIAEEKILNLAKEYKISIADIPSKGKKYLEIMKPEVYKELYG